MRIAAVLVTALLALSAGCTVGPSGSSSAPPSPTTPSAALSAPPSAPSSSRSAPGTPVDPSQTPGGDRLGQVVATRTSARNGAKLVLKLYPVLRDGGTSHVNVSVEGGDGVELSDLFSDGSTQAIDQNVSAADGIQLIDGKHAKAYLVASDGHGQCLCSRDLAAVFANKGAPILISAAFAAPPADVTQVDVRIPSFGTVARVPVQ